MIWAIREKTTGEIALSLNISPKLAKLQSLQQFGYSQDKYEIIFNRSNLKQSSIIINKQVFPLGIEPINIPTDCKHVEVGAIIKGIGDAKSRLAMIQTLKKLRPGILIDYIGLPNTIEILECHPDIHKLASSSHGYFNVDLVDVAGRWENARGTNPIESREEIYTLFSGLPWQKEKPKLYLAKDEIEWAYNFIGMRGSSPSPSGSIDPSGSKVSDSTRETRRGRRLWGRRLSSSRGQTKKQRIGITLRSAEIWKDWRYVLDFIELARKEYEVWAIDHSIEIDTVKTTAGLNIRQVMSILCYMDCVLSPDTAIHHLCEALDIPCIALFGSMDTQRYYNRGYECSVEYIQGKCIHGQEPCMYKTCEGKGNFQPCMDWFEPTSILKYVERKITSGSIDGVRLFK